MRKEFEIRSVHDWRVTDPLIRTHVVGQVRDDRCHEYFLWNRTRYSFSNLAKFL